MTKAQEKEREEFHVTMKTEFPAAYTHDVVRELLRLAKRHGQLQEKACNEQVPEGHDKGCEDAITSLCNALGVPAVLFSGDPRGYTVKLKLPSGRSNHWGGETWGVPQ
jgi:hypothetical protein